MNLLSALAHYLLIPIKIVAFWGLSTYHRIALWWRYPHPWAVGGPDLGKLKAQYADLTTRVKDALAIGPAGAPIYLTNPDHQALRHGALAWSYPTDAIIAGISNYIVGDRFVRGFYTFDPAAEDQYMAPPNMPIACAHAITTALEKGMAIPEGLKTKFLSAVDAQIKAGFDCCSDTNIHLRWNSDPFDAIYALSLLTTAHRLSGQSRYKWKMYDILLLRGYGFLLLAPLTYLSEERRNYFVDHGAIMALRTSVLNCPVGLIRMLFKHALKWVARLSYAHTNPYFCALAHECGVLSEKQRSHVLSVHENADALRAAQWREIIYTGEIPSDYSTHTADEFLFDELHSRGLSGAGAVKGEVVLNGLCLARSLCLLSGTDVC